MSQIRTFLAVQVSDGVRERACEVMRQLGRSGADVKWVESHNLHITLQFLGDVSDADTAAVCSRVTQAVADVPSFGIECRGAGAFPDASRPRTLWLGITEGAEQLAGLHDKIDQALDGLRIHADRRRFHPHLTIGRLRKGGGAQSEMSQLIEELSQVEIGSSVVERVIVYASFLDKSGPRYDVLAKAPLKQT